MYIYNVKIRGISIGLTFNYAEAQAWQSASHGGGCIYRVAYR